MKRNATVTSIRLTSIRFVRIERLRGERRALSLRIAGRIGLGICTEYRSTVSLCKILKLGYKSNRKKYLIYIVESIYFL